MKLVFKIFCGNNNEDEIDLNKKISGDEFINIALENNNYFSLINLNTNHNINKNNNIIESLSKYLEIKNIFDEISDKNKESDYIIKNNKISYEFDYNGKIYLDNKCLEKIIHTKVSNFEINNRISFILNYFYRLKKIKITDISLIKEKMSFTEFVKFVENSDYLVLSYEIQENQKFIENINKIINNKPINLVDVKEFEFIILLCLMDFIIPVDFSNKIFLGNFLTTMNNLELKSNECFFLEFFDGLSNRKLVIEQQDFNIKNINQLLSFLFEYYQQIDQKIKIINENLNENIKFFIKYKLIKAILSIYFDYIFNKI